MAHRALIRQALSVLGVDRLVFGIQDAAFPGRDEEDLGRGSPYSCRAQDLFGFVQGLGFDGVQLGPQGATHPGSPSPYEAAVFSRNPHDLPLLELVEQGILPRAQLEAFRALRPAGARERMPYGFVLDAYRSLVETVGRTAPEGFDAFLQEHRASLLPDALYPLLCQEHARPHFAEWKERSELGQLDAELFLRLSRGDAQARTRLAELEARYAQPLLHAFRIQAHLALAHHRLRSRLSSAGLALYGDLQVGLSSPDEWRYRSILLPGYRMGAPPSRTNPEGQPWGYRVLDPEQLDGAGRDFLRQRLSRALDDYDGVRVDHPHGWVDPWVYQTQREPLSAVQGGARLRSSPNLPDHPRLNRYALVGPDQLELALPRYADGWVSGLFPAQVEGYAVQFDELLAQARARGKGASEIVCEVLSTLPRPVQAVLERHGLGRFRVLTKARLEDPRDVYGSENARPEDWVMLGTHDTPTVWSVVEGWTATGELPARAHCCATQLSPPGAEVAELTRYFLERPSRLATGLLAQALCCPARNVYVFFGDLFGFQLPYNVPGTVHPDNWTARVPVQFEQAWARGLAEGRVLDLQQALVLAVRARRGPEQLARALAESVAPAAYLR